MEAEKAESIATALNFLGRVVICLNRGAVYVTQILIFRDRVVNSPDSTSRILPSPRFRLRLFFHSPFSN